MPQREEKKNRPKSEGNTASYRQTKTRLVSLEYAVEDLKEKLLQLAARVMELENEAEE